MTKLGFDGNRVVITGAAGGLGRAFALAFAAAGARVLATDVNAPGLRETAELSAASGQPVETAVVDVTSQSSLASMTAIAEQRWGGIDTLVNNAAIFASLTRTPFEEISEAEWDRVMAVNVKGAWMATKAVAPSMKRQRAGAIVNVSSATVMSGSTLWLHYVTSKGALIAMTRALARELGDHGIRVNAIAPGFTLTEASLSLVENAAEYGVAKGALKRAATTEDMVGATLFLASRGASFISGQTIVVDGGRQFL
jgi:NAD(P)-dependent dehydrogenase (short-subunit alcohol dehydrogenase family)